jgi:sterol desaturase/sphingolipid hydroxylase (fatty acid hydroxylase superfamily)
MTSAILKRSCNVRRAIRFVAYPLVLGGFAVALVSLAAAGVAYWPAFPLLVVMGLLTVAALERIAPYEPAWNRDHGGDTRMDILHLLVTHALIQSSVAIAFGLRSTLPDLPQLWPTAAPMWAQVLLAGMIMDMGLYTMHRASHVVAFLWRLHSTICRSGFTG